MKFQDSLVISREATVLASKLPSAASAATLIVVHCVRIWPTDAEARV
jgi:hypothetical protein